MVEALVQIHLPLQEVEQQEQLILAVVAEAVEPGPQEAVVLEVLVL